MTIDDVFPKFKRKFKKALVTGGAGFIGSHIVEELVTRGFPVVSIDDYSAGKKINLKHLKKYRNFTEAKCDITDKKNLEKYFKGVDIVLHNAASKKSVCLINPRRDLEVNSGGAYNLLELATKHKIKKFVHASTGSVYGEAQYFPQDEKHPTNPVSYYGVSKLGAEKYVQVFNKIDKLNTTILRYFHVYGTRQEFNDYGGVVAIFTRNLVEKRTPIIFGTGRQERSFTYVKDVVKANLLVATLPQTNGQIYNCASGIKVTINDLYREVFEVFGQKYIKPIHQDWKIGDIKVFNIDNQKIKKLGMTFQTNFSEQVKETVLDLAKYIKSTNESGKNSTK